MSSIELLSNDSDFDGIAENLSSLLWRGDNQDIKIDFPRNYDKYNKAPTTVAKNLKMDNKNCLPGVRRQFIAFDKTSFDKEDEMAVGMSTIQIIEDTPDIIDPATPNVSIFICSPFRGKGIGRYMMKFMLDYAEEFNGQAWTKVRRLNVLSDSMIRASGFSEIHGSELDRFFIYPATLG